MESPACRGMASCAGSMLPACIHSRGQQQVTALPCSLLTVYMVNIHSEDCRKCSQHWFHFEPHPRPPHLCSAHRQWETGPESLGHSCTVPSHCAGEEGSKGTGPVWTARGREGTLFLIDDTTLFSMFGR